MLRLVYREPLSDPGRIVLTVAAISAVVAAMIEHGVPDQMKRITGLNACGVFLRSVSEVAVNLVKALALFGGIGLVLVPAVLQASEPTNAEVLDVRAAADIALGDNPGLAEMQARYEAMAEMPEQMGSLPDPVISFGAMNLPTDTFDLDQEPMTQLQIGFSQSLPFPGKLGLLQEASEFEAAAASLSVDEVRLKLANNVTIKWWQLHYLDRAIDTIDSNQALLRQFIEVAKTKYETGMGLQQDVLLAQLELSRLLEKKIQVLAMRRNQAIGLNILMNRQPATSIVLPQIASRPIPPILDEKALYQIAESSSPVLLKMDRLVSAADSRVKLAKRDLYPDFNLSVNYGFRDGENSPPMGGARTDFVSVMVGVKVPLYASTKQDKAVRQRSSEFRMQRYALLDEKNSVMADISTAVTDYRRARDELGLYEKGIIPQARQTVESMLAGYQVNQVDFLNLVRSQMTLLDYELNYWKSFAEANQALSRLQATVGKESIYE